MQKLAIKEFKDYCIKNAFTTFIYFSGNQKNQIEDVDVKFFFNQILFLTMPDAIALKAGNNLLLFKGVRQVLVHNNLEGSVIFTIILSNNRYTLLAQRD